MGELRLVTDYIPSITTVRSPCLPSLRLELSRPPLPGLISTLQQSLSELELPLLEWPGPVLVSGQSSDPSSSDMPGTQALSNSFSPTLFLGLPCPRPWDWSV